MSSVGRHQPVEGFSALPLRPRPQRVLSEGEPRAVELAFLVEEALAVPQLVAAFLEVLARRQLEVVSLELQLEPHLQAD